MIQHVLALRLAIAGLGVHPALAIAHRQDTPGCEVDTVYMRFQGIFVPPADETRQAQGRALRLSLAARRNDIRPAYMLAGVLAEDNLATRALLQAGVNVPKLLHQLRAVPGPHAPPGSGPDLAYSRNAVAVMSYAMRHAHTRGDRAYTTLSLLSGIAQCSVDPAARLLRRAHVDSVRIEKMIARQGKPGV